MRRAPWGNRCQGRCHSDRARGWARLGQGRGVHCIVGFMSARGASCVVRPRPSEACKERGSGPGSRALHALLVSELLPLSPPSTWFALNPVPSNDDFHSTKANISKRRFFS